MPNSLDLAHQLHERDPRLALIAMRPDQKRPAVIWGSFQKRGPSMPLLERWLTKPGYTVGVIAGKPSDSLLVLDPDDDDLFDAWRFRLGDYANTLTDRGARGGRLWYRTPVPVESTKIGNMDVIAQGHVIMAPGALHPSGRRYEILNDAPILELPSLEAIRGLKLQPATVKGRLPARAKKILTEGAPVHFRSEAEASAVASMISAGFEFYDVLEAFQRYGHPNLHFRTGGPTAKRWTDRDAERYLRMTFENVRTWLDSHKSEIRVLAEQLQQWAINTVWTGRSGAVDRKVFNAHCVIAAKCAQKHYHASARELAELAGASHMTVIRSNHRLQQKQLVTRVKTATAELAHVWELGEVAKRSIYSYHRECEEVEHFASVTNADHDAFAWKGLGASAAQVWDVLQLGGDFTASELAKRTGRNKTTVTRVLDRMTKTPLEMVVIAPEPKGRIPAWRAASNVNLNEIAHKLETSGTNAARRTEHLRQREQHQANLRAIRAGAQ